MSEEKHTTGPLEVGMGYAFSRPHHGVFPAGDSSRAICLTGLVGEGGAEEDRSIADAHLFSAAALLLEKLEDALPILDDAHADLVAKAKEYPAFTTAAESLGLQCEAARAAIAKARGLA